MATPKSLATKATWASHISLFHPLYLPFPQHVHDLEALECLPCRLEREKAHPGLGQPFDETVVLFDEIVEVFHLPQFHVLRQHSSGFELTNGFGRGHVLVHVDHPRN